MLPFYLTSHNLKKAISYHPSVKTIKADLKTDFIELLPKNIDVVIHLAQSKKYKEDLDAAEDIFEINVNSTQKLFT